MAGRELKYYLDDFSLVCSRTKDGDMACYYTMILQYCLHFRGPKQARLQELSHVLRAFWDEPSQSVVLHPHPYLWYGEPENCDAESKEIFRIFISLPWVRKKFPKYVAAMGAHRKWYLYPFYLLQDMKFLFSPKSLLDFVRCHFAANNLATPFAILANKWNAKRGQKFLKVYAQNEYNPPLERHIMNLYKIVSKESVK